jgi:hypothetical protein
VLSVVLLPFYTVPKYTLGLHVELICKWNNPNFLARVSWKASEHRTGNTISESAQKLPALPYCSANDSRAWLVFLRHSLEEKVEGMFSRDFEWKNWFFGTV